MATFDTAHFTERTVCPVCGSAEAEQLYAAPLATGPKRDYILALNQPHGGTPRWPLFEGTDFVVMACIACDLL